MMETPPIALTFSSDGDAPGRGEAAPVHERGVDLFEAGQGGQVVLVQPDDRPDTSQLGEGRVGIGEHGVRPQIHSREAIPGAQRSKEETSSRLGLRRKMPERPPVFSHSLISPIVMPRSTDLHMS